MAVRHPQGRGVQLQGRGRALSPLAQQHAPAALGDYGFIGKIAQLPFVQSIRLYGSRARGDHSPRSDIDLAVECPGAGTMDWVKVMDIVDEADTLLRIDCVRLDEANEPFKSQVLKEGVVLYG